MTSDAQDALCFWPDSDHVVAGRVLYRANDGCPVKKLASHPVLAVRVTNQRLRLVIDKGGLSAEVLEACEPRRAIR